MRALHVPAVGEHERLSDLPVPAVTAGTVLVRVAAAALNAIDNLIAVGMLGQRWPRSYPVILGRDAAGVVAAVGPGVTHVAVGDEVVGTVPLTPPIQAGTLAEYALMPACGVAVKPAGLDFVTAAAIPFAGAVATAAVEAVDPRPGQTVLVNGASGGVGSYAIQLLAARGAAEVTGKLIARLAEQAAAGDLAVDVTAVLPLEQATDGLRTLARGRARGKIVVSIAGRAGVTAGRSRRTRRRPSGSSAWPSPAPR